jgi:hypothetical protein
MSTVGFQTPTPANGGSLTVGTPYTFRIGVIQDDANGFTCDVQPLVSAGSATRDPAGAQTIGDTSSGSPRFKDWTITPTSAGTLTLTVDMQNEDFSIDLGAGAGERTYTVTSAGVPRSRLSLGLGMGL